MALHDDLLAQSAELAHAEKKRPKQASLRRAASTAYYALFHLLIDEATKFLIAGKRDALRRQLARSFDHGHMKKTAQTFEKPNSDNPWRLSLGKRPSSKLVDVANAFSELQEARHDADYNLSRTFTRVEVDALVARTEAAFKTWAEIAGTEEAEVFLIALLVRSR